MNVPLLKAVSTAALLGACASFAALSAAPDLSKLPPPAGKPVDFLRDIQPIFRERCDSCHGAKKQESNYRLDQKEAALKGGDMGAAIIPGKSAESPLIHMVAGLDEDSVMPAKGERLNSEQVGLLRAWIDQGASWPAAAASEGQDIRNHWAFKAPVRPALPPAHNESWLRTPVDNFILARLEKEQLQPSAEAQKLTLLRRLSLDLTGLPPTIEEADAFLADESENAYEKQVERLLGSPHYGERWARHWLDAARYADSDGYEKDMSRQVWAYRDYVIGAFNRNLPYNQFILEQFAGDQLPRPTQDQIVATGFLRNSMLNQEGAIDPEQFRMDAMFDRMDAIGKGVLGLTIQCAQCHNHKFDPFSQEEYYRLFAFLNNDHEARPAIYTPSEQMQIANIRRETAEIEEGLKHRLPDWETRMAAWEKEVSANQPAWAVLHGLDQEGDKSQRYQEFKDGSLLAEGYAPTKFTQWFRTTNNLADVTAFRLELLTDPNLPFGGPGRSFMGTCALSEFHVEAIDASNLTNKARLKFASVTADYDQPVHALEANFSDRSTNSRPTGPVRFAIDGDGNTAWGIDAGPGRRNQARKAVFVPERPAGFTNGTIWRIGLNQNHGGWNSDDHMNNNLGRFRLSVTQAKDNLAADPLPQKVREVLAIPASQRTDSQQAAVFSYWRSTLPEAKEANEKIDQLWAAHPAGDSALTLASREEGRDTHLLRRGDWLKPSKKVAAGVPEVLHSLPENAPPTRLTFAQWLSDRRSPTTARVFVNRIWQAYFGLGLVSTSEDFGVQSEAPSHPELLDWLACEFMDRGWNVKAMHRLIVNSATYRQSSVVTPEAAARDPYNRLLARGPRFRVEGEIVRDIALAASGLLNPKLGGRSVMPPAPAFLFQPPTSYAPFPWKDEADAEKYRRGLYVFRRRSTPFPPLQTFDVPNADASCVRRLRSNSPLQALVSLNEPMFVEAAQALARKTIASGGATDAERIDYAFRRVLSRPPEESERAELLSLLQKQRQRLAEGWLNPSEIATGSPQPKNLPEGATPTQLAAYTVVSRVLLNLDEAITKE